MLWSGAYRSVMVDEPAVDPFLRLALERARAHPDVDLALPRDDGLAMDVVPQRGPPFRLDLHGLHLETLDVGPEARAAALDRRLTQACRPPGSISTWAEARARLLPLVRTGSFVLGPGAELLARPAGPCLLELVVLDGPDAYTFVPRQRLIQWGVAADEVFATARRNLTRPEAFVAWDPSAPSPIWSFEPGDGHPTSRILMPGWLDSLAGRVDGGPVAALPHAGLLLVTGDGDPATLARVALTAAREFETSPQPLSPVLVRASSRGLEVARVEPAHPAFAALEEARVRAWAMDVSAQAEDWGQAVEGVGVRQEDGRLATGARASGEATRLPEAEVYLGVTRPVGALVEGSWPPWRSRT